MSYKKYSYLLAYKINKYIITDWWFRAITMKTPSSPSKNLISCCMKKNFKNDLVSANTIRIPDKVIS